MKYGEVLYKYDWHMGYTKRVAVPFRYRCESVPGIHKFRGSYFKSYYKTPKSNNERKAWYASEGYGRIKRSPINLPNAWDDYPRADRYYDKCWKKNKIKRQWMKNL